MKKLLLSLVLVSIVFVSTVSAQGINYKGYKTVKVYWGNEELKTSKNDVPPIIMDNRALIPLRLLNQIGYTSVLDNNIIHITDKKIKYKTNLEILNGFQVDVINKLDEIDHDTFSIWLEQSGTDLLSKINQLQTRLDTIMEATKKPLNLAIIYDKYDGNIIATAVCENYKEGLNHLVKYIKDNNKEELNMFLESRDKAINDLKNLKETQDLYFRKSLEFSDHRLTQ